MSRPRANLLRSGRYERLVATWRAVEMLRSHAFEEAACKSIRIESPDDPEWDDLVEEFEAPGGLIDIHAWQVKRKTEAFDADYIVRLLKALHESKRISRGHIALYQSIGVSKVGSIDSIAELTQRASSPGCDDAAFVKTMTQEESNWWSLLGKVAQTDEQRLTLLRRLDVDVIGKEIFLEKRCKDTLAFLYKPPTEPIFKSIDSFLGSACDLSVIDVALLEREVLQPFLNQQQPRPQTLRAARADFIKEIARHSSDRRVLGGLDGTDLTLANVWIPVREQQGADGEPALTQLVGWLRRPADASKTILVLGDVGSGKTELMAQAAAEIANDARGSGGRPLPLLVDARRLVNGKLEDAAQAQWPAVTGQISKLLHDTAARWTVLVDGLDEAGPRGVSALEALRRHLGDRLHALAVASRPSLRPAIRGAIELRLQPWSAEDARSFLDKWAEHDPEPISTLRASSQSQAILRICSSPLFTTLCVIAARDESATFRSRAGVYAAVIDHLVHVWARERAERTGATIDQSKVLCMLQQLAFDVVSQQRTSILRSELRMLLRRIDPNAALLNEKTLELDVGVLVPRGESEYDFAIRGCAEHLAGRELAARGDTALVETAHALWAEETCRHAIGWVALQDMDRAVKLLQDLLRGEEQDPQVIMGAEHLRPVMLAVRVASDLGEVAAPVRKRLGDACLRRLLDETSVWVGDRVAEAVKELASAGGPCWEYLEPALLRLALTPSRPPSSWYQVQGWSNSEKWSEALFHQDPDVRRVALERLSAWVDDESVQHWMILELEDGGHSPGSVPPALASGLALRGARREESFEEVRKQLLYLLEHGGQLAGGAAALALRPGEAPAELILKAIKFAAAGHSLPPATADVLKELRSDPAGMRFFDEEWPSWSEAGLRRASQEPAVDAGQTQHRPPSGRVQTRLCKAIAPRLHHLEIAQIQQLLKLYPSEAIRDICAAATDHPEQVGSLLRAYGAHGLSYVHWSDEEGLGRAAVRHSSLRATLLELWRSMKVDPAWAGREGVISQYYPGRALHWLVMVDDLEAIQVYAEWLPGSIDMIAGMFKPRPIPADVLDKEQIRAVALRIRDSVWEYAFEGRDDEQGKRIWLSPTTAGSILHCLWPVWIDDSQFCGRLRRWVDGDDVERLRGALVALHGLRLPDTLRDATLAALRRWTMETEVEGRKARGQLAWETIMDFIRHSGFVPEQEPWLRSLVQTHSELAFHAASVLIPQVEPEDAHRLSTTAAESPWWRWNDFYVPEKHYYDQVVRAAPGAWAAAILLFASASPLHAAERVLPLFDALPHEFKEFVAVQWATSGVFRELPWAAENATAWYMVRPADRMRQVLFDLGLKIEYAPVSSEQS